MATETIAINIERNDAGLARRRVDPSQFSPFRTQQDRAE